MSRQQVSSKKSGKKFGGLHRDHDPISRVSSNERRKALKLTDLIPTTDVLLALEPEELAGFILEYFQSKGDPNKFQEHPDNFPISTGLQGYNQDKGRECRSQALMEAWRHIRKRRLNREEAWRPWLVYSVREELSGV